MFVNVYLYTKRKVQVLFTCLKIGLYEARNWPAPCANGTIPQLAEHCTGNREVIGPLKPVLLQM